MRSGWRIDHEKQALSTHSVTSPSLPSAQLRRWASAAADNLRFLRTVIGTTFSLELCPAIALSIGDPCTTCGGHTLPGRPSPCSVKCGECVVELLRPSSFDQGTGVFSPEPLGLSSSRAACVIK